VSIDRTGCIECVVNLSEGRDLEAIDVVAALAGTTLLDVHTDPEHHRSVLTLAGGASEVEDAARAVVRGAMDHLDLRSHQGIHPRLGVADVVPFVPLAPGLAGTASLPPSPAAATSRGPVGLGGVVAIRNRFARWAGTELDLPCFLYGPERSLPDLRRQAFRSLPPDAGPSPPPPTAGASSLGARHVLVAYNLWITMPSGGETADSETVQEATLDLARRCATAVRGPAVRALGLPVGGGAQVSCNLTDPEVVGIADLYDAVAGQVEAHGGVVARAELVGLAPLDALENIPRHRWKELDLGEERTIEARLAGAGHSTSGRNGWSG
jgi:glutamate formiminotransferase